MRLSYRLYLCASAFNYHAPRRFTKAGLLAGTGMILAGAIGSDLDQSVAFQAFALLFALFAVALISAPFFRGRFAVDRRLPRLATVDQPFRYPVKVTNTRDKTYRGLELLEDLADPRPTFKEFAQLMRPPGGMRAFRLAQAPRPRIEHRPALIKPALVPPLGARGSAEVQVEVVPLRRGPLRFSGVTVARSDALGLFRGFIRVPLAQTVLVLPKRYPVPPLGFSNQRNYQPGGVALASSVGESDEFASLREYRPGDPFRRIHWRSWARVGRPIVKEHQDEYFVRHALVLDTFAETSRAQEFEEGISVAASFACTLETQESLLDLLFAGDRAFHFTTGRGLGQSEQVLEVLASIQPSLKDDFEALHRLVLRHASVFSACVCVFVNWDEARRELVRQLRSMGVPVLTLIVANKNTEKRIRQQSLPDSSPVHFLRPGEIGECLLQLEGSAS